MCINGVSPSFIHYSHSCRTYVNHRHQYTGWRTKCHTIDCARNKFLLLQKHLTPGTELILIGWKIVPNEEYVQCDHRFASQPLANEPLPFLASKRPENVAQLRAHIVKLCCALSEDLCRKVVTNARVRLQEVVRQIGGHIEGHKM